MTARSYLTTAIPYVNAAPHLGHALELVQADALARHHRSRGRDVRFLTGTDEYAPKNAQAAAGLGLPVEDLVARNAARFVRLCTLLDVSNDDFIRTSTDPRHVPTVERLWRQCATAGDLYRGSYRGRYCSGCEQFVDDDDLVDGRCPEHRVPPADVEEDNWFFRLSRHADWLHDLIESGALRIEPEHRRNEVLAFVARGLADFSVSRPAARARGWGVPVPGDADQTVYVWFDALANYVSALGYGTGAPEYDTWWVGADARVHLIGKGIVRFHALSWPAILRSAGLPPPTTIVVHDYLTVDGSKIGKSLGNAVDPDALVARVGADALRWWLLREVARSGDTDFTHARLVEAVDRDLANGVGNLVQRVVGLVDRVCERTVPPPSTEPDRVTAPLLRAASRLGGDVDAALARYDFREALDAILATVDVANRTIDAARPWELARHGEHRHAAKVVGDLVVACRAVGEELAPFVPALSRRIDAALRGGRLRPSGPAFPRLAPVRR